MATSSGTIPEGDSAPFNPAGRDSHSPEVGEDGMRCGVRWRAAVSMMAAGLTLGGAALASKALAPKALAQEMLTRGDSAERVRPDPTLTPGAIDPTVTQANIHATICRTGWTRAIRPPQPYTEALKRRQVDEYGYPDRRLRAYEEDHLIPLSLGGSPTDPRNLWPQPRHVAGGWDAARKDDLELWLHDLVCQGRMGLAEAQHAIAGDWVRTYRRYPPPPEIAGSAYAHGVGGDYGGHWAR